MISDKDTQSKYGFSMKKSLACHDKVLTDKTVVVTDFPATIKIPSSEDMRAIVESAGGKFLSALPKKAPPTLLVVSCQETVDGSSDLASKVRKFGGHIVAPAFLFDTVMRKKWKTPINFNFIF